MHCGFCNWIKRTADLCVRMRLFPVFVLRWKHLCAHQLRSARAQTLRLSQCIWLCLCVVYVCMCTPPLKYFSRSPPIPNGTAGEQKLGPSVACAILNQLAALEGLSVITAFSPNPSSRTAATAAAASPLCPDDVNKYSWPSRYDTLAVFFIIISVLLHVYFVCLS